VSGKEGIEFLTECEGVQNFVSQGRGIECEGIAGLEIDKTCNGPMRTG
jgi:hypothetical protein